MVRVLHGERDRAVKVPAALVKALAEAQSQGLSAWREAREAKRFALFQPALERLLELRREQADALGHAGERYDALLEGYEPGMRVARLTPVLERLRGASWCRMVRGARAPRRAPADLARRAAFDAERAVALHARAARRRWASTSRPGRQDKSIHPFTGGTHPLRRAAHHPHRRGEPAPAPSSAPSTRAATASTSRASPQTHYRTPLAAAPSMGLHESQSRLWENVVGRSRAVLGALLPAAAAALPGRARAA